MYRLKMFHESFGLDEKGPLQASLTQARQAAQLMKLVYKGRIRVEIHRIVDLRTRVTEKVE